MRGDQGGELRLNTKVIRIDRITNGLALETTQGRFITKYAINCAGLHSDRMAKLAGVNPLAKIIPFRGEYYAVSEEKAKMIKGNIYPLPDPRVPFLGVHLTPRMSGQVKYEPNYSIN